MECIDQLSVMRFRWFWSQRTVASSKDGGIDGGLEAVHPLKQAGQLLKARREERGLSMRDLSREIRITTPVLEALERGWVDRLPEAAYLGTMLIELERHLELPPESLHGALPASPSTERFKQVKGSGRFTLGSIDILNTWQGSVVYGLVMLGTLLALNHQQRYLAQRNTQQLVPIPPAADDLSINAPRSDFNAGIPGLRPLEDSRRRHLSEWLPPRANQAASTALATDTHGVLQVNLSQPTRIQLTSAGGDRSELAGSQGRLTLQLQGPVNLSLQPPPQRPEQVLWNGRPQAYIGGQPGIYRLSQTAALSP